MPIYGFWVEPRHHEDIKHIRGCISAQGCRCAAYADLNPRASLPAELRAELDELEARREAKTLVTVVPDRKPRGEP